MDDKRLKFDDHHDRGEGEADCHAVTCFCLETGFGVDIDDKGIRQRIKRKGGKYGGGTDQR
ncbi:MAG TPA: hypothetical protein VM493_09725, partial [Vicinamibacterales bacterium]|nr:hypothetical protein [Vicinamibacterales bacterium]